MACGEDGKLFFVLNAAVWPLALVRNLTSSAASFWCVLCVGTARKEPPRTAPLPGTRATSHLPAFSGPDCFSIVPSIHDGQGIVANVPFLKPAFHCGLHCSRLADSPARVISMTWSQDFLTPGLLSMTSLLEVS